MTHLDPTRRSDRDVPGSRCGGWVGVGLRVLLCAAPAAAMPLLATPLLAAPMPLLAAPRPLLAQPVLTGVVVSAEDGAPVPGMTVTVETWDGQFVTEGTSGVEGRFRIAFEEPGTFVVSAGGPGFARSKLQRVDLDPGEPTEIRLEVTPREMPESRPRLPEVEAAPGEIAGRVIDAGSGQPVRGATVALLHRREEERIATVTTGTDGAFRIRVAEVGVYRLRADLGEFGRSETILVEGSPERGLSLTVELISDPVELAGIIAEGQREIFWWQQEKSVFVWPYYERRHYYQRLNIGRFYDGQYLQDWGHVSAYEFLRAHTFPTARRGRCDAIDVYLEVYYVGRYTMGLEGLPHQEQPTGAYEENVHVIQTLSMYGVSELEGIEVYREGAFAPPDLSLVRPDIRVHTDACEQIVIWPSRSR